MEYKCPEKHHNVFFLSDIFLQTTEKTVYVKLCIFLKQTKYYICMFCFNKKFNICIESPQTQDICLHWWKIKWKQNYAGGSLGSCLVRGFLAFLPHFSSSRNKLFETQNIETGTNIKNQTTSEISNYISHLVNSNSKTV